MADPGMLSLFGDDSGLFSDGLDGLGDCFPQQASPAQPSNPSLNHEHQGGHGYHQGLMPGAGQPKLGQMYDHGPYAGYEQPAGPGGRMMGQNGLSQGPPSVNMNGMASHYHGNAPGSGSHHGYAGDAGGGAGAAGVWGPQQGRSGYQQPPAQPGPGPNQMSAYQMSQGSYGGMQGQAAAGNPTRIAQHYPPQSMAHTPAQEPAHYLGHVGMGGTQIRHPPPQGYPNLGHAPRYPHSPSRQPSHPHQHQQGMGGFGGAQYPGYQAQYAAMGPGMGQGAGAGQAMGPGQLGQRFTQGSGAAAGQQNQRYPPGPAHQTHSAPMQQQAGQQGQAMHPLNHPQTIPQPQNQAHLSPATQVSYPSPSSMSPMRVLGTPTPPPPQQGRPPSAGLAAPPEVAGYAALQSPPGPMAHAQRTPQAPHPAPHQQPPSMGQLYPAMGPQRSPQLGPARPQQQQGRGH